MKRKVITGVTALLLTCAGAKAETEQLVKGTRVMLSPPAGFVPADRFSGFISKATGASIMVTEMPAPYLEVAKGFNAAGLSRQGMTLLKQEKEKYGDFDGSLISASQAAQGVTFLKWVATFGDDKTTYLVTASFPKEAEAKLSESLKQSVKGARVSQKKADPLSAVNFRVSATSEMQLAKVFANNIILTKGGKFPAKSSEIPVFLAGASPSQGMVIPDKKSFAEARMQKVATLKAVQPKSTKAVRIDGLEGFESVADAMDVNSGTKMFLHQVVLFDKDGYYLMQGLSPEQESNQQLAAFQENARTFRRTGNEPETTHQERKK